MKYEKYIIFMLFILTLYLGKVEAQSIKENKIDLNDKMSNTILIMANPSTDLDCSIFGDKNDAGEYTVDSDGNEIMVRPASIRYLVNSVLKIVRIIIPILIILLGSIDFAKAVMYGKEDEMKKVQKTFIMRLVAGVAVFFVPIIVDVIMSLAEIVWEGLGYTQCSL